MSCKKALNSFIYKTYLKWHQDAKALLISPLKPTIELSFPQEFGGDIKKWNPEELFISSVSSCFMFTFLYYAKKMNLRFLNYESKIEGEFKKIDNKFAFSKLKLYLNILVERNSDIQKTEELLKLAEKNCPIANSIRVKFELIFKINSKS